LAAEVGPWDKYESGPWDKYVDTPPPVPTGTGMGDEDFAKAADSLGRNTGEPVNRGLAGLLELPVTLVNASASVIHYADKKLADAFFGGYTGSEKPFQFAQPITAAGEAVDAIAPPEEQRHGLIPRSFEILGASVIPAATVLKKGEEALKSLSAVPSVLQQMGRASASAPGKATAYDVAASFSAAGGGSIARIFTDNETTIAMAELGFAFVPTSLALIPGLLSKWTLTGKMSDKFLEVLAPFTEKGAKVAASARMQDVAGDPQQAAAKIDPDSPVPPLQQTGDEGLIKLQNMILKKFPHLKKEFSEELNLAIERLAKEADFGGDPQRARHLLNVRSQIAVEEAAAAVAKLGPKATPRQISAAAKKAVSKALDDATTIENYLWNKLDLDAPADVVNAKTTLDNILVSRSDDADPAEIPAWLINRLRESPIDDATMASLKKQGFATEDGVIDPQIYEALVKQGVIKEKTRSLNDVKTLRSRVLQEIRDEKGSDSPNRNKLRILGDMQGSLLDDMTASGVAGVDDARAFSNAVNERFRQGRVGSLLGLDKTGAEKVDGADLLNDVVFGRHSATNTQKLAEMANEGPEQVLQYLKAKYIESVYDDELQRISARAHKQYIKNLLLILIM